MRRTTYVFLLALLLTAAGAPTSSARPASAGAVQSPVLKWAYGGCATSVCQTGWYASPAVADVDNDTQPDVIWGSYDVVALNGANGTLKWRGSNGQRVWPAIAIADLTGDGSQEVIVGRGGDQLTVYNAAGGTIWTRNPFGSGEIRTLAVADLEQDGQREIVVGRASGGSTKQLNVFEPDGSLRSGWPARRDNEAGYGWGMYNQNVVVADLNDDGNKEIIGPTDTHYITALDRNGNQLAANTMYGNGKVWSQVGVHVDQAADLRGYAECGTEHRPNFANSAPVVSDIDNDGQYELIVVGDVYNCAIGDPAGDMYLMPWILKLDRTRWQNSTYNWTTLPPDPGTRPLSQDYSVIQNNVNNAVTADLDGDGIKEILFPSYDGRLYAYWLDKTQHGSWPFDVPGTGIRFASEPVVADLNNDGKAEVLFTSWPENGGGRVGQLHVLDYLGNQLFALDLPAPRGGSWNGGLGAPTLANIDSDPDLEIVIGTVSSGVVAYDLPGTATAPILWGTGRGNVQRTGVAAAELGFSLHVSPTVRVIPAGATTTFTINAVPGENGSSSAIDLSATVSPTGPMIDLSAATITPPGSVTLTVTDTHSNGLLQPGVFYTVQIKGISGNRTSTTTVAVLVGGYRNMLPLVRR